MDNPNHFPLLRGGQQINVQPVRNRFAIRPKKGVDIKELSDQMGCEIKEQLKSQHLTVLEVSEYTRGIVMENLGQEDSIEFTSDVFTVEGSSGDNLMLSGELTVQFKENIDPASIEALINEYQLSFVKEINGLDDSYVFRVTPNTGMNTIEVTNRILEKEEVQWSEPNVIVRQLHFYTPSDTLFQQQWHLYHNGGIQLTEGAHIDAVKAWDITKGERGIVVAIADDSVDIAHRDFSGEGKIVAPRDLMGLDFNPTPEFAQENHGTAVAGVAVAESNGLGVVGAAPGCSLMPIRTSGYLDDNSIEELFEWAVDNGAAVISNSWGAAAINFPLSLRQSNALRRAATEGRNGKGCVILFAAGNSNRPVNAVVNETGWPEGTLEGPTQWHDGFASHPDVIAVAACTSLNTKSFYSSWGKEISICAPSNNGHPGVGSSPTYPFVSGVFPGRGIVTTDRLGPSGYSSADYTNNFGGTSSACPLAAGVAALVLSVNPDLSATEVKEILESTADKIIDNSTDPQLGNAYGTYDENGHSLWFGYGKVNAYTAVLEAQRRMIGTPEPSEIKRFESVANSPIPDNDSSGIVDTIEVKDQGVIEGIQVKLDITHTYIGDLVVELVAPSGNNILLHNRNGGSANNIIQTYSTEKFPNLASFIGEVIRGNWQLKVSDRAGQDTGLLNSWELVMEIQPSNSLRVTDEPGELIPDADPDGIQRTILIERSGILRAIKVDLDITHTFISDLVITLKAPSGKEITLHERSGGSADNLLVTFSSNNLVALNDFKGEAVNGDWVLTTKDLVARDTGKLNSWALEIETVVES